MNLSIELAIGNRVSNVMSKNGNMIANQFIITSKDSTTFQSYASVIVVMKDGKVYLDENKWNYSKTTSKYRSLFLNESTKQTAEKIKNGEYILANLN